MRRVLRGISEDLSRIRLVLERIPLHLKTILLLIKEGSKDLVERKLPHLLEESVRMARGSLTLLQTPQSKFKEVKDLLDELDSLITPSAGGDEVFLQVRDIRTQWTFLMNLFTELAMQADRAGQQFLLQFNWILEDTLPSIETYRDLILQLLKSKLIEIDRTIDLFAIISDTYLQTSTEYTNDKLAANFNLILLSNEEERKRVIQQHRHELPGQAVHVARLALQRHDAFLQRNQQRTQSLERFLNETTSADLNFLLSVHEK